MTYNIIFSEQAEKEFDTLDGSTQKLINTFLETLIDLHNAHSIGTPLQENNSSYRKFGVGDYNIIAEIHDDLLVVLVLAAEDRGRMY